MIASPSPLIAAPTPHYLPLAPAQHSRHRLPLRPVPALPALPSPNRSAQLLIRSSLINSSLHRPPPDPEGTRLGRGLDGLFHHILAPLPPQPPQSHKLTQNPVPRKNCILPHPSPSFGEISYNSWLTILHPPSVLSVSSLWRSQLRNEPNTIPSLRGASWPSWKTTPPLRAFVIAVPRAPKTTN